QADNATVRDAIGAIQQQTDLPVCVGFGVRTPEQAARFALAAQGVVVGSALVEQIANASSPEQGVNDVLSLVSALSAAVKQARN
ncbi:MAG: tryptophan synthase subunit alpha, partial [Pseudomonas sp.]|nr:tryptophan synthase subunit alpha [Pseudomonas sp.]